MPKGICGRADLARMWVESGTEVATAFAEQWGYARIELLPPGPEHVEINSERVADTATVAIDESEHATDLPPWVPARTVFYYLENVEFLAPAEQVSREPEQISAPAIPDLSKVAWRKRPATLPSYPLLARWPNLLRRLQRYLAYRVEQRSLDVERVIKCLSRGELLGRIPRKRRRQWGQTVQIVVDRSQRLVPCWFDQDSVAVMLPTLYPRAGAEVVWWSEGAEAPTYIQRPRTERCAYMVPLPDTTVLVLGDLGCLDRSGQSIPQWVAFGEALKRNGNLAVALTPCGPDRWHPALRSTWTLLSWEEMRATAQTDKNNIVQTERLLTLVSPAVRVEPGFLRSVRQLAGDDMDAATESDLWQHSAVLSQHSGAATLDSDAAKRLREAFDRVDEHIRAAVLALLRAWRSGVPAEIWFEELTSLSADSSQLITEVDDLEEATAFFVDLDSRLRADPSLPDRVSGIVSWSQRFLARLPSGAHALQDPSFARARDNLWDISGRPGEAPAGFEPRNVAVMPSATDATYDVFQSGQELHFRRADTPTMQSRLATVTTRNSIVHLQTASAERVPADFWRNGSPPPWAADWGQDEYGPWVEFEVQGVRQRMRWMAPGEFTMGSPDAEPGRYEDEGPQHAVTLTQGYWLFDTPCTQALWQAVMVDNPSYFKSPTRPVEQVSWQDAQRFIEKLNERVPGLALSLPTEAQWEYACRAGTTTALYSGDIEILGGRNAPALDPIAWYSGNSGIDFELDNGFDSSDWPEKQYPHKTAGTHSVGRKEANAWGLYDMLGNVWEWCQDGRREFGATPQTDPVGSLETGARRVFRGGSWGSDARLVRSAYRLAFEPGDRSSNLGFRCARVQQGEPGAPEPRWPKQGRVAEPRPAQATASEAVRLDESGEARLNLPQGRSFLIQTDRERIRFGVMTRPAWASAMGRDRFGLWADFEVPVPKGPPVTHRLRWINPGRFLMGSPDSETYRWDNEGPQHEVFLTKGYWLAETACSQALWLAVMSGENPSAFKDDPNNPVEQVNWDDVQMFLTRINKAVPGLDLTLPTEAQWEYACRGGMTTPFGLGENITPEKVNYNGRYPYRGGAKGKVRDHTIPVGSQPPNPWGLHEMHGNVREWCQDGQRQYTAESWTDPVGPVEPGRLRVVRGGSWYSFAQHVRSASRDAREVGYCRNDLGFRCARLQTSES